MLNSRIGRVTPWRSLSEMTGSPARGLCVLGWQWSRLPSAEPRFLEQGPKLVLGEESGKQSGDVPPGAGIGPKRVTGQARERHGRQALHGSHRHRVSG